MSEVTSEHFPRPPSLSQQQADAILERLIERKVAAPCPRCENPGFQVVEMLGAIGLTVENLNIIPLSGPMLPMVITACNRCGFIAFHAFLTLDLNEHPLFKDIAPEPLPRPS